MTVHYGDRRLPERFWSNVVQKPGDHWEWVGGRGYRGRPVYTQSRKPWHPRRAAYHALVTPVPPEMRVVGTCDTKDCANPDHAMSTTVSGAGKRSWRNRTQAMCKRGHDLDDPSNVLASGGKRFCVPCRRLREASRSRGRKLATLRRLDMEVMNT